MMVNPEESSTLPITPEKDDLRREMCIQLAVSFLQKFNFEPGPVGFHLGPIGRQESKHLSEQRIKELIFGAGGDILRNNAPEEAIFADLEKHLRQFNLSHWQEAVRMARLYYYHKELSVPAEVVIFDPYQESSYRAAQTLGLKKRLVYLEYSNEKIAPGFFLDLQPTSPKTQATVGEPLLPDLYIARLEHSHRRVGNPRYKFSGLENIILAGNLDSVVLAEVEAVSEGQIFILANTKVGEKVNLKLLAKDDIWQQGGVIHAGSIKCWNYHYLGGDLKPPLGLTSANQSLTVECLADFISESSNPNPLLVKIREKSYTREVNQALIEQALEKGELATHPDLSLEQEVGPISLAEFERKYPPDLRGTRIEKDGSQTHVRSYQKTVDSTDPKASKELASLIFQAKLNGWEVDEMDIPYGVQAKSFIITLTIHQ